MNSGWQDVFKEEATFPHGKNSLLNPDEEWPSDDSEDDDYNPERNENSCSISRGGSDDIASEEELSTDVSVGSDVSTDGEIVSSRRQKRSVDYKKLYDEMFGKDGPLLEQISDDEDWGPGKRKRRGNESDAASTLMTLYESERNPDVDRSEKKSSQHSSDTQVRRSCFRIPRNAVEKLRQVFSETELPSRAVKDNLSKELGLNPEKVSKWFKNARYLALKTRKGASGKDLDTFTPGISKAPGYENVTGKAADLMASDSDDDTLAETVVHSPKNAKAFRRKHPKSLSSPLKKSQQKGPSCGSRAKSSEVFVLQNKDGKELSDDVSLKKLRNTRTKEKRANLIAGGGEDGCRVPELEMERLCKAKGRLEYMRQKLLKFQIVKAKQKSNISRLHEQSVIYVPIAEVKENV
ncbi:hypothetical protein ACFX15_012640 [Malus domestica]